MTYTRLAVCTIVACLIAGPTAADAGHQRTSMERLPSLASGISGPGFELAPNPKRAKSNPRSDSDSESGLTFSPTQAKREQRSTMSALQKAATRTQTTLTQTFSRFQ